MPWFINGADAGDFAGGALAWDLMRMMAAHRWALPDGIDLSGCVHLKSYSLACLAAVGAVGQGRIPLTLPNDLICREHCVRHGLHRWFTTAYVPPLTERATNVPVEQLIHGPSNFAHRAMEVWAHELGTSLSAGVRRELENHLDELILNALGHSGSAVGCFVAGQGHPQAATVEVAIVDLGMTIKGHLTRNPRYAYLPTDEAAIDTAKELGVSGTAPGHKNLLGEDNSGVGLTNLYDYCAAGMCDISIVSGTACVCYREGGFRVVQPFHNAFPGTLVNVKFRT